MRKLLFTLSVLLLLTIVTSAQSPSFFNYQGVARNSVGNALVNKTIKLRLTIHDGSALGLSVYSETRTVITNAFGLFSVQVGGAGATNVVGSISGTNWGVGSKWMQVEIDPEGGNTLKDIGTTQLTSVPYSLYTTQSGDLVLPFNKSQNEEIPLFKIINTGNNSTSLAFEGLSSSTANNATALRGIITSPSPGVFSAGVIGQNNGTGNNGIGVYGTQNGTGAGVYGSTPGGVGVYGNSTTGTGVYGQSVTGPSVVGYQPNTGTSNAGYFQNSSTTNAATVLRVQTNGLGEGVGVNITGFGKGGVFTINNAASGNNVLEATTNGLGKVALLQNTGTLNSSNILEVSTNGLGRAGLFQNTNVANTANALEVIMSGTGFAASFTNTNASPKALRTAGAIQFTGVGEGPLKVMSTVDGSGNATWQNAASVGLVSGSGTLNYVPKWTPDGTVINNSQMFDNGDKISIAGAIDPVYKLTMNGTMKVKASSSDSAIAIFENTSTGANSDGIIIKLNKTHPAWSGGSYLNVTNVGAEIFQSQINTIWGWVVNHNPFTPNDLYSLAPSSLIAGTTCSIINVVIDKINSSLGLPLNMPPVVMPQVVMPEINFPRLRVCILDECATVTNAFTLFPQTTLVPQTTLLPGFQMLPTIPHIPCGNLPNLSVPNIDFNNVTNSLTNNNHFVSFFDKDNRELGSIRAQSVNDWSANYLDGAYFVNLMAGIVGIDVPQGVAAAVAGFTDIAKSYNSIGVEYASGHADYAEWLERANPGEIINAGDIVGVKGGKVSKNLDGAEQILAVSHNPIVLGNMPTKEKEPYGNKIAFTGQVPVKVVGPVNVGDYIIAKGDVTGYGVAVNPAHITTDDLKFTVGRSWETNLNDGPKMVNTLIGIDNGDYIKIMKDSQEKISAMELRLKTMEEKMDKILSVPKPRKNKKNNN